MTQYGKLQTTITGVFTNNHTEIFSCIESEELLILKKWHLISFIKKCISFFKAKNLTCDFISAIYFSDVSGLHNSTK